MGSNKMRLEDILYEDYPKETIREPVLDRVSPTRLVSCPRGAFFSAFGYRGSINPQTEQNFEYGSSRHESIQKILQNKGITRSVEQEIKYNIPPLLGFVDALIELDGVNYVLEIKTTSMKLDKLEKPLEAHLDQIMLYMYITNVYQGIILYESKTSKQNSNPWKTFYVDLDNKHALKVLKRGERLLKNIESFQIPLPDKGCWCSNPACFSKDLQKNCKKIWRNNFEG